MKRYLLCLLLFACCFTAGAQDRPKALAQEILDVQAQAWNRGDIEGFMQTYWQSDSLLFIGKSGVQHGWQPTLNNYRKAYPDTTAMGRLSFTLIEAKQLAPDYLYVVGKWMLSRSIGDLSGHFDLLIRRIKGQWRIIADHSS